MKEEEQRIAIAKVCGWRKSDISFKWCHPDDWEMAKGGSYEVWKGLHKLPNYLNDLNAMHEAENILTDEQYNYYSDLLCDAAAGDCEMEAVPTFAGGINVLMPVKIIRGFSQTAKQRAEAFLKTLNLWVE